MSADKALSDMKWWAIPTLFLAILSGNIFIGIIGIISCSTVLCCSRAPRIKPQYIRQQTTSRAVPSPAPSVLGGLHAIGMLALGARFSALIAECTDIMTDTSCSHLDNARDGLALDRQPWALSIWPARGSGQFRDARPHTARRPYRRHEPPHPEDLARRRPFQVLSRYITTALAPTTRGATGARHLAPVSEGPVQGCGQFWGNFILASPGATDCFGCGKRIGSYDAPASRLPPRAARRTGEN